MGLFGRRVSVLVPVVMLLSLPGALQAAPSVWWERSTTKVLKDQMPKVQGQESGIVLEVGRNEYEAFQVVVRAGDAPLIGVEVKVSPLAGPEGVSIPSHHATLYLAHFLRIDKPSECDQVLNEDCTPYTPYVRLPGDYPDPLIPFVDPYSDEHPTVIPSFDVPGGDLQVVFVDLFVPSGIPAGEYSGTVQILSASQEPEGAKAELAVLTLAVTVWDYDLPTKRSIATSFGFSHGTVAGYHPKDTQEERDRVLRNYEWEVHRHRMDFTHYSGGGVQFHFDAEDQLIPPDYSAFDSYIGPRVDGSYFPDGAGVNRFDIGMFRPGHGTMGMTESQFSVAARAMAEHLDAKGWLDHVYLYSLDEPWMIEQWLAGSFQKIRRDVDLLNALTDLWKGHVLVTGPWQAPLDGFVDIWCPVTPMYGDSFWPAGSYPGADKYAELLGKGQELWFYACNANYPPQMGYDIDTRIGHEPRLLKWGAWYEKARGFLYWSITYWFSGNPWQDFANYAQFGDAFSRNGDGVLIYPGNQNAAGRGAPQGVHLDGPVVSYRMKQVRDGLEDWELFLLAEELGAGTWTRTQVESAYGAFGQPFNAQFDLNNPPWTLDADVLFAARRNVALKVQHLLNPDQWPDPEPEPSPDQDTEPGPEPGPEPTIEGQPEAMPDIVDDGTGTEEVISEVSGPEAASSDVPGSDVPASAEDVPGTAKKGGSGCGIGPRTAVTVEGLWLVGVVMLVVWGGRKRRTGCAG